MKKHIVRYCLALVCFGLTSLALAEQKIGVVVMHGKWGAPDGYIAGFAQAMARAGFLVETPEMPWSGRRLYDTGMDGLQSEIGAAVKSLKDKGATKLCLAGHSMGAAGAIFYAGHAQIDCLIALAPGHNPENPAIRERAQPDLAKAKEMVAKGEAEEKAWFEDYNTGSRTKKIRMSAKIFIEYFDGDGPMNMANNASRLRPGPAVLWVVGSEEAEGIKRMGGAAYQKIPAGITKQFVEVPGGHLATPEKAIDITLAWIRDTIKN